MLIVHIYLSSITLSLCLWLGNFIKHVVDEHAVAPGESVSWHGDASSIVHGVREAPQGGREQGVGLL